MLSYSQLNSTLALEISALNSWPLNTLVVSKASFVHMMNINSYNYLVHRNFLSLISLLIFFLTFKLEIQLVYITQLSQLNKRCQL